MKGISVKWYLIMLIISTMWALPGSAAAAFMTLSGMENLLSHQYYETENRTEMYSDIITAILPSMNNTNLTEPVNFTIHHRKVLSNLPIQPIIFFRIILFKTACGLLSINKSKNLGFFWFHQAVPQSGFVTCVYWEDKSQETEMGEGGEKGEEKTKTMRWSVEGCWVAYTNENYTVCSCSHLSTFALILQIGEVL